jgi:glycosyltransferase involved in cell wall biosynthesis
VLRDLGRAAHARAHARRVATAARAHEADLIIETQVHLSDSGVRAARASGVPLLLDDCSPAGEEQTLGAGLPRLARRMFARQATGAAILTVSSPMLRDRLVTEGIPWEKISVIANGVDPAGHGVVDRDRARRDLGVPDRLTLGFAGSFQPWHRVDLLLDAMAALPVVPQLLLVGDGPGFQPALAHARRLGVAEHVIALGSRPPAQIPLVLAACDIGVLPGTNDYGQPMKLLEYAAAGLATVAPDLPPVRALIDDGSTGLLFAPGDVDMLRRAVRHLLEDGALRNRLASAARRRVAANAGWTERGRDLIAASAHIVDQHPERRAW